MNRVIKPRMTRSAYINLVRSIGLSDFKVRYNDSILGYFWTLAKPLLLFGILFVVFSRFLSIGDNIPFYSVQLLLGVMIWNYFSECTVTSMRSLVDKGGLMRKVYFPREIIILGSSLTAFLTLLLNLAVMPVFMAIQHVPFRWEALWAVPLLMELFLLTTGLSLLLSSLFVRFRDIGHIWEVGMQALFYATPILYPVSLIPERFQGIVLANPVAQILQDLRAVVISPDVLTPHEVLWNMLALVPYLLALAILITGAVYFKRASKTFAEEV
jgi:ABC-2 type transport system permease protein